MAGEINWRKELPGLALYEQEPLARRTTFRIGGPARWFLCPKSREEAEEVLKICSRTGIEPFFFGNGSNILAPDEGYGGVVVSSAGLDTLECQGNQIVAGSGALLSRAASFAAQNGLSGLEFAQGIPGSVGGGARMNAGAYGGELKDAVAWVEAVDREGTVSRFAGEECRFAYRHSRFCEERLFITAVCFSLTPGDREEIREKMADFAQRRRDKQPLDYPSAGSTFKRPQGHFAAALIDQCGLKGLRVGGAQVSEKHAGFVVNVGKATARDVLTLMAQVQETVAAQTGVVLEPEIEIMDQAGE